MVGWHHRLNGHEFEQALGVSDGQGSLAYCSPWGCKELDTTELNRIGKDSDAGRDWGQKEKGTTKDEMAGWHH